MNRTTSRPIRRSYRRKLCMGLEQLEGRALCAAGTFAGVPDVVGQFVGMQSHADALAFTLPDTNGAPDSSDSFTDPNHYQGITRYPGAGAATFYVTQQNSSGGYVLVTTMSSRPTDGERLGSNLQRLGVDTEDAVPPVADSWRRSIRFNGTWAVDGKVLRGYEHPGGMAIVDNVLMVVMDTPTSSNPALAGGVGAIVLFDLGSDGYRRVTPLPIQVLPLSHKADNLAVIKDNGNYLIYVNGNGGSEVYTYRTNTADLRSNTLSIRQLNRFNPASSSQLVAPISTLGIPFWPTGYVAHQSSTFIRQSTSSQPSDNDPLYLVATRLDSIGVDTLHGNDHADLYRVTFNSLGQMKLTWSRTIQVTLRYSGAGTLGNFAAAGGAYVTPSGELMLYATPHSDVDTSVGVDNVRIAELGHRYGVRPNSPLLNPTVSTASSYQVLEGGTVQLAAQGKPSVGPWVELFDDVNFGDRSIKVNYRDRALYELSNFNNLDGFNDKTSSVRWRLPVGMSVELYDDDNFSDTRKVLVGNGAVQQISNLGGFGDKVSSMRFIGADRTSALTYAWDLDGDGVFGEIGGSATRGDENTRTPLFETRSMDGPASVNVWVRVADATGRSSLSSTTIHILNAPPTASITGPTSANSGVPLTFTISATDPSAADRLAFFTFVVDFGDGTTTQLRPSPGAVTPVLVVNHTYSRNGLYVIRVRAIDKDGASSLATNLQVAIGPVLNE